MFGKYDVKKYSDIQKTVTETKRIYIKCYNHSAIMLCANYTNYIKNSFRRM